MLRPRLVPRSRLSVSAACVAAALALTACGGSDEESLGSSAPSEAPASAPASGAAAPSGQAPSAACPTQAVEAPAPAGSTTDLSVKPQVKPDTTTPPTQVQVADIVEGDGQVAQPGDQVAVKYVGVVRDTGTEFDASWNQSPEATIPFEVCGQGVIPGFSVAPLGMKVGGRRLVAIPPEFGYGPQGQPAAGIEGDDVLVFVIDLVSVS